MGKLLLTIVRSQWDRSIAIVAAALSLLLLVIGYFGVASTPFPAEQTPYIVSGGITGILLMGMAATLWLSADMRDEWRKLDELAELLRDAAPAPAATTATVPVQPAAEQEQEQEPPGMAARSARRPRRVPVPGQSR